MAEYKYTFKTTEHMARAVARDAAISYKTASEVCRFIRGKTVVRARAELERVTQLKLAIPHVRYNSGISHQPGCPSGSYPVNCALTFIALLDSVTANAQSKGLATGKLRIIHTCAHKAAHPLKGGRLRGRAMKRAHVEVAVDESVAPVSPKFSRRAARSAGKKKTNTSGVADTTSNAASSTSKAHTVRSAGAAV